MVALVRCMVSVCHWASDVVVDVLVVLSVANLLWLFRIGVIQVVVWRPVPRRPPSYLGGGAGVEGDPGLSETSYWLLGSVPELLLYTALVILVGVEVVMDVEAAKGLMCPIVLLFVCVCVSSL